MNITRLALENNRTTWVLIFALVFFGIVAFNKMPKDYDPGFIIRTAQVVTYFPGASPQRVEELVTDKIEKVVQQIPELDFVKSTSKTGVSIVSVNIKESYKEMRPIWDNLRRKIETVENDLPSDAQKPIVNDEFGDVFGVVIGLTAEGYSYREMEEVAEQVRDELLRLPEAAKVDIFGAQEQRVFIEFENAKLASLGISPGQLKDQLAARNIVNPGGSIFIDDETLALEPSGNFESVEDIAGTIINITGSEQVILLSDIARVYRDYVDPAKVKVRVADKEGMTIAISMRHGGNNLLLGEQVLDAIHYLESVYPIGVDFKLLSFLPREVEQKVDDFVSNLIQAVLVVTVVMLFSLGLRTGLIVASLIPMSMVFGILAMSFFDISIDQISLAALIIALGMLVDNGIVMSESIMVQMERGKSAVDAAVDSADELKVPLLVSSLTTGAAFLPIFLAESATGEYTASLFKVVTITLLCSWLLAMTMIPMLCVLFTRVKSQAANYDAGIYLTYKQILMGLIKHRWMTLAGCVLMFFLALQGLQLVPKLFFPPSDRDYFKVELELPIGTRLSATEAMVKDMEAFLLRDLKVNETREQGVTDWVSYVGNGGPRFLLTHTPEPASSNYALMIVSTTSYRHIDELMAKIETYALQRHPDLLIKQRKIENGSPIDNPVEVRLSGSDIDVLTGLVNELKAQMRNTPGLKAVSDDWGLPIKKLQIKINQTRARRAGVSSKDIASSLQTGLSGLELTRYREGDELIPVTLRSVAADRQDIGKLEAMVVYSQASGKSVPLKQVADIEVVWENAQILRRDRLKSVTVGAQLDGITADEGFSKLKPWLEEQQKSWPFGYSYELGGEAESSGKANQSIAEKMPIAVFIIVILLVGQFNSLRKSAIVLTTVPLGFIGVVAGLLIGQSFFGFMTLLGIISLAGIVINNAIVLLERIKYELDQGDDPVLAIIQAAQQRMRPILLTTATTVLGLVPLYLGGGEMWEPMALAIMGGLLFSTILTLGVVPVLYALLYRISVKS
ncbi:MULTISPECIES: efflux RND transporter permease subunit [Pseudoalteromonas]|uniref:MMPL family transporter n=1 Tax=Pseudoalteromonas rubra TaxID=43658 RepID=A0A5S3V1E0_9GAMM|nr:MULTISPECIES: efflux RND transporter permease subunit [Pseudoalteromonas]MCG7562601.1 efflux RND transporter permease subunit [Pseudoalteromonas sp. McH1-42]MEC4089845.1 efflux RND transporter permease subunit [Pseudoalteromonas rubra]QPB84721.1 MMPL family transporter [Pseudoalteromonas rubra]